MFCFFPCELDTADILVGGAGDDTIYGGCGPDTLYGGGGSKNYSQRLDQKKRRNNSRLICMCTYAYVSCVCID